MPRKVSLRDYIINNQSRMPAEELAKTIGERRLKPAHMVDTTTKVEVNDDWTLYQPVSEDKQESTKGDDSKSTEGDEKVTETGGQGSF